LPVPHFSYDQPTTHVLARPAVQKGSKFVASRAAHQKHVVQLAHGTIPMQLLLIDHLAVVNVEIMRTFSPQSACLQALGHSA
jgi:hypothetical protein